MTPQQLHEAWLVVTAITTMTIGGIALFLLVTFRRSGRRWFFWALAIVLLSVTIEQLCAETKNYYQSEITTDTQLLKLWLAGRTQEAVASGLALIYLVFGQNGKHEKESLNKGATSQ